MMPKCDAQNKIIIAKKGQLYMDMSHQQVYSVGYRLPTVPCGVFTVAVMTI